MRLVSTISASAECPSACSRVGQIGQLGLRQLEAAIDALDLLRGRALRHGLGVRLRPRAAHRGTRRSGMSANDLLAHGALATAR